MHTFLSNHGSLPSESLEFSPELSKELASPASTVTETFPLKEVLIIGKSNTLPEAFQRALSKLQAPTRVEWISNSEEAVHALHEKYFLSGGSYDLVMIDAGDAEIQEGVEIAQHCKLICPTTPLLLASTQSSVEVDPSFNLIRRPKTAARCQRIAESLLMQSAAPSCAAEKKKKRRARIEKTLS